MRPLRRFSPACFLKVQLRISMRRAIPKGL